MRERLRRVGTLAALIAATAAIACAGADRRVREVEVGMTRDSTLKVLGGTSSDSMPYIYHSSRYFAAGGPLEVLYYDAEGRRRFRDSVPGEELTPIVLQADTVSGVGWDHLDLVAAANNITTIPRSKAMQ
ncbi:MAG: hypothetical protein ACT4P7_18910 [Gemmatimonadaceae bacterium]